MHRHLLVLVSIAFPSMLAACGGDDHGLGPLTETECPDDSTLTYENFGEPFMAAYCLGCHSVDVQGDDREGAPSDHNFDTQFEIQAFAEHIDQMAGSGPAVTNTIMPPGNPKPSMGERVELAQWLACGAP
jgi:uncharacterized membrane protein